MSAIDDVKRMLDEIASRNADSAGASRLEGLFAEISMALSDIVACLEKPEVDDDAALVNAVLQGLRELRISPEVHVNVPAIAAPEVHVNVQPAQVVVMEAPEPQPHGWEVTITSRDGNGQMRTFSIRPEN